MKLMQTVLALVAVLGLSSAALASTDTDISCSPHFTSVPLYNNGTYVGCNFCNGDGHLYYETPTDLTELGCNTLYSSTATSTSSTFIQPTPSLNYLIH